MKSELNIQTETAKANVDETNAVQTPGQLLVQAREIMGLSQRNMADRLCLNIAVIRSIDEDRTPLGVAPAFLRGYMRSYAKVVNVSDAQLLPLIEAFNEQLSSNIAPMKSFSRQQEKKEKENRLKKTTWLIGLLLLVVLGIWWQTHSAAKVDAPAVQSEQLGSDPEETLSSDGAMPNLLETEVGVVEGATNTVN